MKSLTETRVTSFLDVHMRAILSQQYSVFDNYIHKHQYWAIPIFWSPFHRNYKSRHFLRYISFYRKIKHNWTELILGRTARAKTQITDILKEISLKGNCCKLIKISIQFVPKNLHGKLTLVQVPNRHEAIDWKNDDKVLWCICVAGLHCVNDIHCIR